MALDAGVRLGPYEIVAPIGAGGMGEVYRARDTRLDRIVAIKVLPPSLASDPQLRERFDREARAISALNHPNICTLHDIGHQDGIDFLVLEYLEGETLADRLARTASSVETPGRLAAPGVPVADAIAIAVQIADALDKAHRAGIVHRDLKPANIFLVRSGGGSSTASPRAKLLDFGLAKAAAPVIATSGLSMLPTTPPNLTAQGTILGTFQYMAPEQIEGLDADARTDIFAFGAVLFEMLAGRQAFEGRTRAQLLGSILKDEPPPVSQVADARLNASRVIPPAIDRIVAVCLAKDPDDRWQTARDLLRELTWAADQRGDAAADVAAHVHARPSARRPTTPASWVAWAVAALLAVALALVAVIAVRHIRETTPAAESVQFAIQPPEGFQLGGPASGGTGAAPQLAVSSDGRQVAFVAGAQSRYTLWVRPVGSLALREMPGTEGASFPFWSPDSRFVGFFAGGKLKKVQLSGGPPVTLCDASGRGATWNRDGVIVFSPGITGALQRVSSAGGVPSPVTVLDAAYGETAHRWPSFLPDQRHFLYAGVIGTCCPPSKPARIKVGSLDSSDTTVLMQAESSSVYASGYLLFNREGTLMAQSFDAGSRRLGGDPFPLSDRVANESSRYASFSISDTGVLAYARGAAAGTGRLTWFDRTGKMLGTLGDPGSYGQVVLSPDERFAAVSLIGGSPPNRDVWVIDVARGVTSRLTFDPAPEDNPVWSPDSARVAFLSYREGDAGMRIKLANGVGNDEPLLKISNEIRVNPPIPYSWSADGRVIAFQQTTNPSNRADLWMFPITGDKKPFPFLEGPGAQQHPIFSPDGKFIAYDSDESGTTQVYVQPFPATGGRFQVSKDGGAEPMWRADGRELFFLRSGGTMMVAAIDATHEFQAGVPQALFGDTRAVATNNHQYAVSRDAKRFLIITPERAPTDSTITVVVNWPASVQR